jgi:undecaprenyl-diphosphatase
MFTSAGKFIFHRARPGVAIYPENSFSFPSGHATIAVAFYGFLTYALIRSSKKWKRKINIFFVGFILIFLIGFSRLYLGVHYFSDVWGGYLAGAIWLIIAISFSEYFSYKKVKYEEVWKKVKKTPATIGIVLTSIVFYIIFALNYQMPNLVLPQEVGQIKISNEMMIFSSEHLKYTETLLGDPQEPLSFIIIAENDQVLMNLFEKADWVLADEVSFSSSIKLAKAAIRKQPYPEAPMTPDFWNASVHDFGFEKATEENDVSTRHHTRFWKTNYIVENGEHIYVGTASFDNAIKWGITHRISPDIDKEREFLYNDLEKTGNIISAKKEQFVDLKLGSNFLGDAFFTDGKIYILGLN